MVQSGVPVGERGKQPVLAVAGPYGHPFHPILVPIPIGAWVVSLAFDVASRTAGEPAVFVKGAFWLIGAGVVGALVAALFGFLDLFAIPTATRAFRTALVHMTLNLLVTTALAASFLVRRGRLDAGKETSAALIALSVVALAALAVSGWLGGKLAYRYGVRVADETTQAEGFEAP